MEQFNQNNKQTPQEDKRQNDAGQEYKRQNDTGQEYKGQNDAGQEDKRQNDAGQEYKGQNDTGQEDIKQDGIIPGNVNGTDDIPRNDPRIYSQNAIVQTDGIQQTILNMDHSVQETLSPRKLLSKAGIALSIFAAVVLGVQTIIEALVRSYRPEYAKADWYVWLVTAVSIVLIGFPVYALLMRRLPNSPRGEAVKLSPAGLITIFFICTAAMYITNIFSTVLTILISLIKGEELVNPAADAILNGNFYITIIYAAVIAPVIEELIFRKILLDKLRRFGELPAILMTGIAFGLFHLNLSQFFYATVLGFIFAYVTIRTNTVIYAILLHMMINLLSSAIAPFAVKMNPIVLIMIFTWEIIAITIGVVFFILNIKKIRIVRTEPVMKTSSYFLNTGTILYTVICMAVIVIATVI